ncbi:MAG: hypothetical protein H6624_02590 [Bdellovibrionaceae bacterium]|nr:hypothetical protein [Bdellovibrionales bacterium]MCB9083199.1 hypothetical protein [Pseudobdellovibrionaceae bacterium]
MEIKHRVSKVFGVLVLGGAALAATASTELPGEVQVEEEICQVAVVQKKYALNRPVQVTTVCIDQKSDEEAIQLIQEMRKESCYTPFCGCWLG